MNEEEITDLERNQIDSLAFDVYNHPIAYEIGKNIRRFLKYFQKSL